MVTSDQKLFLIFEFVEKDLRSYVEQYPAKEFLDPKLIKVFFSVHNEIVVYGTIIERNCSMPFLQNYA